MAELPPVSPSQIKLFRGCQARWGAAYLDGQREPDSEHTAKGTAVHAEMEAYGKQGTYPTSDIAKALLKYSPKPGRAIWERELSFALPSSPARGYIDVTFAGRPGYKETSPELLGASDITIQDWKTTTNLRNAKTIETLLDDEQSNMYAYEAFFNMRAERVHGRWVYVNTCGEPRAVPRVFSFERSKVVDICGAIDEDAAKIQRLYQIRPKWTELKKNEGYCYEFRKQCHVYGQCRPDLKKSLPSLKGATVSTAFKAAIPALPGKPAPALPGKTPPALPNNPAPALPGKTAPALPKKPVDINQKWDKEHTPALRGEGDPAPGQVDRSFVNPPSAPETAARTPEELAERQGIEKPKAPEPDDLDAMELPHLKVVAESLGLDIPPKSRKTTYVTAIRNHRLLNPGEQRQVATNAAPAEVAQDDLPQAEETATPPSLSVEGGNKGDGSEPVVNGLNPRKRPFNLFINCAPEGVKVLRLADLLPALNKRVEMEEGVHDYRLVQYGQGPGMLCLAYQELQHDAEQQNLNLHGDLVIDARTPEGATLLETISRYAANVIRDF